MIIITTTVLLTVGSSLYQVFLKLVYYYLNLLTTLFYATRQKCTYIIQKQNLLFAENHLEFWIPGIGIGRIFVIAFLIAISRTFDSLRK